MVNSSFPALRGLVNSSHTSDVHAAYPVGNLPTSWRLVIISSLVSLVIAVIGFKSAMITWSDPTEIETIIERARKGNASPNYYATRHQSVGLMEVPPEYELQEHEHFEVPRRPAPSRMFNMNTTHMNIVLISFLHSTTRCVIALILSLKVLVTKTGSHSACSSLLLLLSVQTLITNRSIPRIMNMILVLDSLAASAAFLVASLDCRGQYYGELPSKEEIVQFMHRIASIKHHNGTK